jgi:isoquinoline 1-oxidoreductase beta subunit
VESVDARRALAVKGVERVVQVSSGVAVVARDFWSARRGRDALRITWARGSRPAPDSSWIEPELRATLDGPATVARRDGDPDRWLAPIEAESAGTAAATRGAGGADAARANGARIDAEYFTPFLAHAALEPLSAAAHVQADRCDLWVATQAPSRAQDWAARVTGLPLERVFVHTRLIGGAFGRRGEWDFVVDAVEVAKAARVPVKLMWTREDDLRHDFYRPATANRLAAQLGADGLPVALAHRVAGASVARRRSPEILQRGTDFLLTQGSGDLHYAIPNVRIDYREVDQGVPVGFWRSVGHSHNGFVIESFVDEVAHAAGRDPFEYRATLLAGDARLRGVLELAAREAGWGRSLPPGRGLGIACLRSYGTCVAEVAEVEVVAGAIRVPRVVCAVDCGRVVNPRIVEQQMQGGILFGLTAALHGEVSFRDGAAQVSNYHDYPVLRIDEVPHVDVHVIASEAEPGGCGEPATPVIAPAVANAVFAATGRRLRRLPLRLDA